MIIDIRDNYKYKLGHIKNSVNITYDELYYNYEKYLDKSNTYYIYCDSGARSLKLVNYLKSKGFNCVNVDGGYNKNGYIEINI